MTIAIQLDRVMNVIWGDGNDTTPTIKALVSYVRNHRVNHENIFEVIDILFGENVRVMKYRETDDDNKMQFDIQFDDDSQVWVCTNARGMIGSELIHVS